jgi:nucleoside-diphosphate-sugar epimerase
LVTYLVDNNLVSKICVADKVPPQVAGLSEREKAIFENQDLVTFKQANLARDAKVEEVFNHDGGNYTYVINLAGATKYSQPQEVYQENIIDVARVCALASAQHHVARYIEVSTSQIYNYKNAPTGGWAENGPLAPWTGISIARMAAEQAVQGTRGLNYVIVRPSIVYGPGDILGITPRVVIGAIYKESGEKMELLWSKSLKMNTVHVEDVCRAIWHLTNHGNSGAIYNLSDKNDTDQGKINDVLEEIYGIKTGFLGKAMSSMAKALGMKNLTDTVNDKHLKPWSDLCKNRGIHDTPLTPYLDEELLYKCDLTINGSAIESTGFNYQRPNLTADSIRQVIHDFEQKAVFPHGLI